MNIGIAGAGLIGRILVLKLARKACSVHLSDQDSYHSQQSCGIIAAGTIAPFSEMISVELDIAAFGLQTLKL